MRPYRGGRLLVPQTETLALRHEASAPTRLPQKTCGPADGTCPPRYGREAYHHHHPSSHPSSHLAAASRSIPIYPAAHPSLAPHPSFSRVYPRLSTYTHLLPILHPFLFLKLLFLKRKDDDIHHHIVAVARPPPHLRSAPRCALCYPLVW